MASLFAHNRILPNLKRRSRPTNKSDTASPSKAKLSHILPNVAEEDESSSRNSCSSVSSLPIIPSTYQPSRRLGGSATFGARPTHDKRDSRRVVLTGVEGLTFDDFFPPSSAPRHRTPSPPRTVTPAHSITSPASDCTLDDINLRFSGLGISLEFPSPPSSATPFSPLTRRRELSPTPSTASSEASTASPTTPCSTPPTSDDESPSKSNLMRAPTFKSQRASVLFMTSMPDLCEPIRKNSVSSFVEDDVSEEAEWIARDVSDIVTLSSPIAPISPITPSSADFRARPDSMSPLPRRGRSSKALPVLPRITIEDSTTACGPSAQLDPTFPLKRRSYMVPSRPPPPPPAPKSPGLSPMEQATDELLAELANAALGAGFRGTELTIPHDAWSIANSVPSSPSSQFIVSTPVSPSCLRPPPRSSIPADINDICEDSPIELSVSKRDQWPTTPQSISVYSQTTNSSAPSSPLSSFDFNIDVTFVGDAQCTVTPAPESPLPMRRSPSALSVSSDPERTLRSRWSTSTLGSLAETHSHSWLPRFTLSPSKKAKSKAAAAATSSHSHSPSHSHSNSSSPMSSPISPLTRKNALKGSHVAKRSIDSDHGVCRRDSRSSRVSEGGASDSGDSTASAGLRRKPIPITLFAVSSPQNSMPI